MAEKYDYQRLMTACGGAFFGAIIGAIIATLIILSLDLLKIDIGNTAKIIFGLACVLAGAVWLAIHEMKKHAEKPA